MEFLVAGDFKAIEELSRGARLSAEEMERAVRKYGRTLIMPKDENLRIDAIRVSGKGLPTWSVVCDLWTKEEGRSDLSLEMTVIRHADAPVVEIDGIHAL